MTSIKVPQLPESLDPATLTAGMVPTFDPTVQRWVPKVADSGTSGSSATADRGVVTITTGGA